MSADTTEAEINRRANGNPVPATKLVRGSNRVPVPVIGRASGLLL